MSNVLPHRRHCLVHSAGKFVSAPPPYGEEAGHQVGAARGALGGPRAGAGYRAREFPGADVCSGAVAVDALRVAGLTNELPFGPATTASCSALPLRNCGQ